MRAQVVRDAEHAQQVRLQSRGERFAQAADLVFVRRELGFRQGVQGAVVLSTVLRGVRRRGMGQRDGYMAYKSIDNVLEAGLKAGRLSSSSSCLQTGPGWGK